jgi:hypothetical protein
MSASSAPTDLTVAGRAYGLSVTAREAATDRPIGGLRVYSAFQ